MRIFVTGATGYIGSAIVRDLLEAGHQVTGLARSDAAAAALTAAGAAAHRGDLDDLDSLRSGAAAADGVIHTAFTNMSENTDRAAAVRTDLRAVETLGTALDGADKPLVVTSGTGVLTPGRLGTEENAPDPRSMIAVRVPTEVAAIAMAARGVRTAVVRTSIVHSEGDKTGWIPTLIRIARAKGVSAFVGDGSNRWPAVHRLDLARLFRLAAEAVPAGSRLHGVGEEGVPFRDIAEAIGRHLNLPVVSMSRDEVGDHFGFLSALVSGDNPTSSRRTQELLGWRPVHPTLIADIDEGHYFKV